MPTIRYKLLKSKDLSNPMTKGYQVKYPQSYSLPAIMRVHVQDDKTGEIKVRKVRYCENETSIFFDEQDPKAPAKKIKFVSGVREVDTDLEPNLWKIMELVDLNASKPNRNKKRQAIFERYDPEAKHKIQLQEKKKVTQNVSKFWSLNEEEMEAVAVEMGVKVKDVPAATWKMELLKSAENNSEVFAEIAGSNLKASICANKAIRYSIVKSKNQKWYWGEVELCVIPKSITERAALIGYLEREAATMDAINVEISQFEAKLHGKTTVEKIADSFTAAEALESGMKAGVVIYERGRGWRFDQHFDGLGEDFEQIFGEGTNRNNKVNVIEFIAKRPDIKREIFARINSAAKE